MRGGWRACADRCARRAMACLHLQPTNRIPTFDSLQLGAGAPAGIITTIGSEVAVVVFASPARFDDSICFHPCSIGAHGCRRGSLPGGLVHQGGGQGGRGGAAERCLSSGDSSGPPARARKLRRRFATCQRHALCTRWLLKKNAHGSGHFLAVLACLSACKLASRAPQAPATRRYAARAIGPRTQSITTLPAP